MLFVKAWHIIALVTWFSGLFYLPRLFVYHAKTTDRASLDRFKTMEQRLYYAITWPGALLTTGLGFWLITYNPNYYRHAVWMHAKLLCVLLLWGYHLLCGHYVRRFVNETNTKSERFFRIFNEVPTFLLVSMVLLVVVKPF